MKAEVDQKKCSTAGVCVQKLPEVFRFQEGSKKATVILDEIPPELQRKVIDVSWECPNKAIVIKD